MYVKTCQLHIYCKKKRSKTESGIQKSDLTDMALFSPFNPIGINVLGFWKMSNNEMLRGIRINILSSSEVSNGIKCGTFSNYDITWSSGFAQTGGICHSN